MYPNRPIIRINYMKEERSSWTNGLPPIGNVHIALPVQAMLLPETKAEVRPRDKIKNFISTNIINKINTCALFC